MVLYTLYFIFYSAYTHPLPCFPLSLRSPASAFPLRRGCMQNALARFFERAQILCRWRTPGFRQHSPFYAFSPFFSLSLLPISSRDRLRLSLSLPPPLFLSHSFPPSCRRRNIFPEHYFYRPTGVRTCARSAILSAN